MISIGYGAFHSCTGLTTLDFPDTLTSIDGMAFLSCFNLTTIHFPDTLTSIGDMAFENCSSLTTIYLPDNLTYIGKSAFSNCSGLSINDFPDTLTYIGDSAFSNCLGLTIIDLPDTLTSIGAYAFNGCDNVSSLYINGKLPKIGSDVFPSSIRKVIYGFSEASALDENPNFPEEVYQGTLFLSENLIEEAKQISPWNTFSKIEPIPVVELEQSLCMWIDEESANAWLKVSVSSDHGVFGDIESITWKSSDSAVVEVAGDGYVADIKAISPGKAKVLCKINWGNAWTQTVSCDVDVRQPLTGITIESDGQSLVVGKSMVVSAVIEPEDAYTGELIWSSSDDSILQVIPGSNNNAVVKALSVGTAEITVKGGSEEDGNFVETSLEIRVYIPVKSITLDPSEWTCDEAGEFQITPKILPEDATDKTLEWSSSDERVATVDDSGLVTVLSEGSCVITARTTDGSDLSAECLISFTTGLDDLFADNDGLLDIYNLQGVLIMSNVKAEEANALNPGIYIVRQGNKTTKLILR